MFLNLWAGWQDIFIVTACGKEVCYGVSVGKIEGEYRLLNSEHYTADLKNDEEHFKLIGEIDIASMWFDRVFERITKDGRKLILDNYDGYGNKLYGKKI